MIDIVDKNSCSGCKACFNICPQNCIDMVVDEEGFWYPKVNEVKCVKCGLCEKVCPEINVYKNEEFYHEPLALAAWNKDNMKRKISSSGGIFTSIAEWIILNGGVVFGAGYDDSFDVIHKETDSLNGLRDLRGSKYVQSDINDTYKRAKGYLEGNRKVLFTGTPCQIAGLYKYLQKEYENLYTCDVVCHGVPSPKVFKRYKISLEDQYGSSIQRISFRHKKHGWKIYSVLLEFSNGTEYSKTLKEDPYMLGFLRNYYLRPSCYTCSYANIPRVADITLGDFWGVGNKYPELDDDQGTSLLLVNSDKGKYMMEKCIGGIVVHECDLEHAIKHNPCIIKSGNEPELRREFFIEFNNKDFGYVSKKYMRPTSLVRRGIGFIKRKIMGLF